VLEQVVAPDVRDEDYGGPNLRDVRKALIRPDADVSPAGDLHLAHLPHHVQIGSLIRDQVVRIEIAVRFGEFLDHLRELLFGERALERLGGRALRTGIVRRRLLFLPQRYRTSVLQRCGLREKAEQEGRQNELSDSSHDRVSFENQPRISTASGSERAFIEAPARYRSWY
jgi:hypothetical protein